jgi:hypothetical protein
LQRIFSQNKAGDAANPLWIGKGNIAAHLTQLCGKSAAKTVEEAVRTCSYKQSARCKGNIDTASSTLQGNIDPVSSTVTTLTQTVSENFSALDTCITANATAISPKHQTEYHPLQLCKSILTATLTTDLGSEYLRAIGEEQRIEQSLAG